MVWVFNCHNYLEPKRVKLDVIIFTDYTIMWWGQLVSNRMRNYERQVDTWDKMKSLMRRRFVPSHYYRELYQMLESLSQGTKSVDEYFKEIELATIQANIEEDREATMVKFINGFNHDIALIVELHHYVELEEVMYISMKVEKQLKRKGTIQKNQPLSLLKSWKPNGRLTLGVVHHNKMRRVRPNTSCNHDIKCFCCLGFVILL